MSVLLSRVCTYKQNKLYKLHFPIYCHSFVDFHRQTPTVSVLGAVIRQPHICRESVNHVLLLGEFNGQSASQNFMVLGL